MEINNKIKIVFGIPSLSVGGIERQLIKQLEILDRQKFEIHLITLFDYKNIPNLYEKVPVDVKVYKISFKNKLDLLGFFKLKNILKEIKPDVVVSSMFSANTIFRIFQPIFGYKIFAREHNIYHEKKWWQNKVDNFLSKRSEKIIAVSKSVAEFASKQANISIEKFQVIHNGVEIDKTNEFKNNFSKNDLRRKLNIKEDSLVFLNVGRLKKQKQQDLLIDAFKIVSSKYNNAQLFIVGRGPEEDYLKNKIIENNLEGKVVLTGYSDSVYDFYRASDVFVLSSKYEGFPNVAIEAMAFGLPLLSTKVPGVDEFLLDGENGFLMNENPENISEKMIKFIELNLESKRSMSDSALNTASGFDIKDIVLKYSKLYV